MSIVGIQIYLRNLKIKKASRIKTMKFMGSIFKTLILSLLIIGQVHFAYAQTASILPPAKTPFFDNNGNPLALGTVESFIPNTTTHKTTWQDAAETIPNTNPLTLDSAGRALLLGSGSYRQVVKDRNNNLIWDQVTASAGGSTPTASLVGDGAAVGTIQLYTGLTVPNNYMLAYGAQVSRVTFAALLAAITSTQSIFCSSGSPILSGFSDTTSFPIGAAVEVPCVVSGQSSIISKTSSTVTLAANANVSVNIAATIYPWGNGNGTTTFTLPDYRGIVPVGNNNMGGVASSLLTSTYYGSNPNAIGAFGGSQSISIALLLANLPAGINSSGLNPITVAAASNANIPATGGAISQNNLTSSGTAAVPIQTGGVWGSVNSLAGNNSITVASTNTSGTPYVTSVISPSKTLNFIVKVSPDTSISIASCLQLSDAGTACQANTGTSGHALGFLDVNNTYSGQQTFSNVNVTGGAITGLPLPSASADAATKGYVDSVATGLNILASSGLATSTVLPNTPTYANGTLGVGATLTAGSNSTLTIDGTVAILNSVVLVKNQASTFQNGIYTVTTAGSGSAAWVLTRATYFDQTAEMKAGSYTLITGGSTNTNSSWVLQAAVPTVGTSPVVWVLFSQQTAGVTSIAGNVGAFTLGNGLTNSGNVLSAVPVRQVLTSNTTYYLSPSGNDSNSGTTSGSPWLSCGHAITFLRQSVDFSGHQVIIQFLNGLYSSASIPCVVAGTFVGADNAGGAIIFQGDTTQTTLGNPPNNVALLSTTSSCFQVQNGTAIVVQFMFLRCVFDGSAVYGGFLSVNNVIEGGVPVSGGSIHFLAQETGVIELNGPMYLLATAGDTPDALYESKHVAHLRIINGPFTLLTGLSVAVATAFTEDLGDITVTGTMESTGFTMNGFNIIGNCYVIQANAVIQWQGGAPLGTCSTNAAHALSFPGLTSGAVSTGGLWFN